MSRGLVNITIPPLPGLQTDSFHQSFPLISLFPDGSRLVSQSAPLASFVSVIGYAGRNPAVGQRIFQFFGGFSLSTAAPRRTAPSFLQRLPIVMKERKLPNP